MGGIVKSKISKNNLQNTYGDVYVHLQAGHIGNLSRVTKSDAMKSVMDGLREQKINMLQSAEQQVHINLDNTAAQMLGYSIEFDNNKIYRLLEEELNKFVSEQLNVEDIISKINATGSGSKLSISKKGSAGIAAFNKTLENIAEIIKVMNNSESGNLAAALIDLANTKKTWGTMGDKLHVLLKNFEKENDGYQINVPALTAVVGQLNSIAAMLKSNMSLSGGALTDRAINTQINKIFKDNDFKNVAINTISTSVSANIENLLSSISNEYKNSKTNNMKNFRNQMQINNSLSKISSSLTVDGDINSGEVSFSVDVKNLAGTSKRFSHLSKGSDSLTLVRNKRIGDLIKDLFPSKESIYHIYNRLGHYGSPKELDKLLAVHSISNDVINSTRQTFLFVNGKIISPGALIRHYLKEDSNTGFEIKKTDEGFVKAKSEAESMDESSENVWISAWRRAHRVNTLINENTYSVELHLNKLKRLNLTT